MKKIISGVVILLFTGTVFGQSIFDKFEDTQGVSTVVINKNMFTLLSKLEIETDDKEARDFIEIAESLENLKVFATEDGKIADQMRSSVDKYLKKASLQELMRVKDEDTNIKFYINEGKDENHVKELLMFVSGIKNEHKPKEADKIETVLVSLTGDIDLRKISTLTKKMNLPKELEKAGEKSN